MPIVLSVPDLRPGLRLCRPLYNGHLVLLPAGRILEASDIDALTRRAPHAQLCVGDPILDDAAEFDDDSADFEVVAQVHQRLGRSIQHARRKLQGRSALTAQDIDDLRATVAEIIEYLQSHPVTSAVLLSTADWTCHLQEHTANVLYLCLLIGSATRQYVRAERERQTHADRLYAKLSMDLTPLAMGALLHDVGMIPLEALYGKHEPLTADDREQIRAHPDAGADLLPKDLDAVTRLVVRTHHENMNGSGYPQGLPGNKLHIFTRIVRVADAFDAATSPRVYREAKTPARALWEMTAGPYAHMYDPAVTKMLAALVQPFPIGAKLRLADGRYAVVVRHNRRAPFHPVVIVAYDEDGQALPRRRLVGPIDLSAQPDVQITRFGHERLDFLAQGDSVRPDPSTPPEAEMLFQFHYP